MKAIRLPYCCFICSAMSTTGPHTRDWHSCGVANSSATGFLPRTSLKFTSCRSRANGRRVSIAARFPAALATVSVLTRGGTCPTSGIGSLLFAITFTWAGAPTIAPSSCLVTASTFHVPDVGNGTLAA